MKEMEGMEIVKKSISPFLFGPHRVPKSSSQENPKLFSMTSIVFILFMLQDKRSCPQSKAAPTMIFRILSHGDPCEMLLVCVGWPLASPPVPCITHSSLPVMASRLAQNSVVMAL